MAMISMLIGLFTAFFLYNDAKKQGHGPITVTLWSVSSIFIPYVILPLYFVLGRKNNKQNQYNGNDVIDIEATVVEERINCTQCGREIEEEFLVCPYCQEPTAVSKTIIN